MTKNELINLVVSLEGDLKYLRRNLQFRLDGNDIEGTLEKYKDSYAAKSGAFQAMTMMDNDTFKRSIDSIDEMLKDLKNK
jgi:hypothetical protein|tara:strand:+ start:225 stop:464 length:240 start_codon:yes stop_codon:yes gene_type:complete